MDSSVINFFDKGHILVTGGTGFMGKILIDKLLRTCSGLDQLYLIIRVKKGKEPSLRLKELFDDPVFGPLRNDVPNFLSKVTVIPGDCSVEGLGISESDRSMLAGVLTHVFHGAATVRFDDKLRLAIGINVLGVKEMLLFCQECSKLKSVIHTSTAYSNCPLENLEEKFYPPPMTADSAIQLLDCMSDEKLDPITTELVKPWPNTYSFTKAIAEDAVQSYGKNLPIAVFRPAIVIGTADGPVKGWIDNLYGPTGAIVGVGAGLMRVLYADGNLLADLVPVDMAVNAMICAAWKVGTEREKQKSTIELDSPAKKSEIPIFHFVVDKENTLSWNDFFNYNMTYGKQFPSNRAIWYYTATLSNVWAIYKLLAFFYHLLPALVMDAGLYVTGNKPQMWQAYQKIHKFSCVIANFSTKQWSFSDTNTRQLWNLLSAEDRKAFMFDMKALDWDQYFRDSVYGVRLYLFKEQPCTIPAAKRRMIVLRIAHHLLQLILYTLIGYALYAAFVAILSYRPELFTQLTSSRWASRKTTFSN